MKIKTLISLLVILIMSCTPQKAVKRRTCVGVPTTESKKLYKGSDIVFDIRYADDQNYPVHIHFAIKNINLGQLDTFLNNLSLNSKLNIESDNLYCLALFYEGGIKYVNENLESKEVQAALIYEKRKSLFNYAPIHVRAFSNSKRGELDELKKLEDNTSNILVDDLVAYNEYLNQEGLSNYSMVVIHNSKVNGNFLKLYKNKLIKLYDRKKVLSADHVSTSELASPANESLDIKVNTSASK